MRNLLATLKTKDRGNVLGYNQISPFDKNEQNIEQKSEILHESSVQETSECTVLILQDISAIIRIINSIIFQYCKNLLNQLIHHRNSTYLMFFTFTF